jgi:cleavage and polyadenylation specificity factor subunit 1
VLQQHVENAWQPLAFFSKKLNPAQQKYSAYDRELLDIYEDVEHLRHMLEAHHFTIFTDHKPITYAFQQKWDKCSPRQLNYLDFVAQITTDIKHISGQYNVVADALSRVESVTAPPSYYSLAAAEDGNDEIRTFLGSTTALRLEKLPITGTTVSIYCDPSAGKSGPYVPDPLRLQVFQSVHSLSHPGTKAMAKPVAQRFVWPGVQKDCRTWTRTCQSCQLSKVSCHTVTPLGDFTPPVARFLHVHIDFVGPLPTSADYTHCLTAVVRFTR